MKKSFWNKNKICSAVCIVLLVVVMAAQFLPYWHGEFKEQSVKDGQKVVVTDTSLSVAEYVWFPKDHKAFASWLSDTTGVEIEINDLVFSPVVQLFVSFVGIVVLFIKFGKYQPSIFAGASGILGLYGFITSPHLRLGSIWGLFIVLDVLLIAACVVTFVFGIQEKKKNKIV